MSIKNFIRDYQGYQIQMYIYTYDIKFGLFGLFNKAIRGLLGGY